VRLSRLSVRNFRNLGAQDLVFPPEGVALIGDNAQGKSNFLEAIYYLETFRSFRGARDDQLVAFDQETFRVVGATEADVDREESGAEVAAAFQRTGKRKKVVVDGSEADRLGEALGRLGAVIFSPADIDLVSGGPSERRRFLDIVLSLNAPGYLEALQEYRSVLSRRNASLKGGEPNAVVSAWDPGLTRAGAEVIALRRSWIEERCGAFADFNLRISGGTRATMTYRSSVPLGGAAEVEGYREAFREALRRSAERERRQAVTVVGPHRDEVRLQLEDGRGGVDLRDYGSGGQRRTAALALRLVEAGTIRDRRGQRPLMLLDDVFAELDTGRSERVLELMEADDSGQVVLTAPKEADVRVRRDALARWRIATGRIET
jgi:DNA replication and repair protein RecF